MLNDGNNPVTCPDCGHMTDRTVRWLKDHNEFTCPGCGTSFKLNKESWEQEVRDIERRFRRRLIR